MTWRGATVAFPFTHELERLAKFQARPDDVYVVSFPRSGTTWLQEIVHTLLRLHLSDTELDNEPLSDHFPFLEMTTFMGSSITHAERLQSRPRTIKSHLPYDALPESAKSSGARVSVALIM